MGERRELNRRKQREQREEGGEFNHGLHGRGRVQVNVKVWVQVGR